MFEPLASLAGCNDFFGGFPWVGRPDRPTHGYWLRTLRVRDPATTHCIISAPFEMNLQGSQRVTGPSQRGGDAR
ncbi:MAG TPA: hypothetical protein VKY92_20545 [Verrucomicrobiae bacterium]|nr:hypothetical protein [Verrucomicrobiae bacterium]